MTGYPKSPDTLMTRVSQDFSKSSNSTNSNDRSPLLKNNKASLGNSIGVSTPKTRAETEPCYSDQYSPFINQNSSSRFLPKLKIKLTKSNSEAEKLNILSSLSSRVEVAQKIRIGNNGERTKTPGKLPPLDHNQESPRSILHKKSSLSFSSNPKLLANNSKVFFF